MAYWDGSSGTRDGMRIPSSTEVRQLHSPSSEPLGSDTEENVVEQTEDVVKNFMYQRYRQDLQDQSNADNQTTPQVPELVNFTADPLSRASQVGRQLAKIGDDINRRYADEFDDMIQRLNITESTAYEVFAGLAKKLFDEGINWGRVAALMCLAYQIAMKVLKVRERAQKFAQFLKLIVSYVVRFIKETIAGWIARQGGWTAALEYSPSMSWTSMSIVIGSCVMAIAAVLYISKKS